MRQSQSKSTSKQDLLALNLGSPVLVAMEAEDFERKYTADERAQLKFA